MKLTLSRRLAPYFNKFLETIEKVVALESLPDDGQWYPRTSGRMVGAGGGGGGATTCGIANVTLSARSPSPLLPA
jgi:hypothetical protein